jgi:capsular polysaccharide export protein
MSLFPRFSENVVTPPIATRDQRAEIIAERMRNRFAAAALKTPDLETLKPDNAPSTDELVGSESADNLRANVHELHSAKSNSLAKSAQSLRPRPRDWGNISVANHATGRSFLFLQGNVSRFFERLGRTLAERGHAVHRVNFNGGDRAFWRLPGAVDFCGRPEEWPEFLDRLIINWANTDIILFGDCRPLHRAAIRVAESRALRVHVVEEGYLRPDWITFEEGRVNGHSTLPRDPSWYRERARSLPPWQNPPPVPGSFRRRAIEDVLYTTAATLGMWRFPHYSIHRPYYQLIEYLGWLGRLVRMGHNERRAQFAIEKACSTPGPLFLFPLQLETDYQVRVHSPFRAVHLAIEYVLTSFACSAPSSARLIVKLHPLDNGLVDWSALTGYLAVELGIADRVTVIDGGDLGRLLARHPAVVTVNGTVGTLALAAKLPVVALGRAVYDIAGLTFQGDLDDFWNNPVPPDMVLFDAFRRVLAARCLIPGSFFNELGLELAVDAAIDRLEAAYGRSYASLAPAADFDPFRRVMDGLRRSRFEAHDFAR